VSFRQKPAARGSFKEGKKWQKTSWSVYRQDEARGDRTLRRPGQLAESVLRERKWLRDQRSCWIRIIPGCPNDFSKVLKVSRRKLPDFSRLQNRYQSREVQSFGEKRPERANFRLSVAVAVLGLPSSIGHFAPSRASREYLCGATGGGRGTGIQHSPAPKPREIGLFHAPL
jgi:hypothetical protein